MLLARHFIMEGYIGTDHLARVERAQGIPRSGHSFSPLEHAGRIVGISSVRIFGSACGYSLCRNVISSSLPSQRKFHASVELRALARTRIWIALSVASTTCRFT